MEIKSVLNDYRINAVNILIEISIDEYVKFARHIINNNEFQRKKVVRSKVKEILRSDLLKGCIMPSIVLAISNNEYSDLALTEILARDKEIISNAISANDLLIIDGLQRTYTILEIIDDLTSKNQHDDLKKILSQLIRCEIYAGLNRSGLLYRMITLNTGQASMSTRHLMEILYHDYKFINNNEINLISDKDDMSILNNATDFSFKSMLDGFSSYLDRDENIFERTEILQNIKNLDVLKETDLKIDLFENFTCTIRDFIVEMDGKVPNWQFEKQVSADYGYNLNSSPFGNNIIELFKKSQVMTGFGAALGFLRENKAKDITFVNNKLTKIITESDNWELTFYYILYNLDFIKDRSKKIGNDQRFYFKNLFKNLLNPDSDSFLNLYKSADDAFNITLSEKLT